MAAVMVAILENDTHNTRKCEQKMRNRISKYGFILESENPGRSIRNDLLTTTACWVGEASNIDVIDLSKRSGVGMLETYKSLRDLSKRGYLGQMLRFNEPDSA